MSAPEPKPWCSEEPAAGSGADFEAFHRLGVRAFIATHLRVRTDLSSASRMSRRTLHDVVRPHAIAPPTEPTLMDPLRPGNVQPLKRPLSCTD
jgi:hypothetical protein